MLGPQIPYQHHFLRFFIELMERFSTFIAQEAQQANTDEESPQQIYLRNLYASKPLYDALPLTMDQSALTISQTQWMQLIEELINWCEKHRNKPHDQKRWELFYDHLLDSNFYPDGYQAIQEWYQTIGKRVLEMLLFQCQQTERQAACLDAMAILLDANESNITFCAPGVIRRLEEAIEKLSGAPPLVSLVNQQFRELLSSYALQLAKENIPQYAMIYEIHYEQYYRETLRQTVGLPNGTIDPYATEIPQKEEYARLIEQSCTPQCFLDVMIDQLQLISCFMHLNDGRYSDFADNMTRLELADDIEPLITLYAKDPENYDYSLKDDFDAQNFRALLRFKIYNKMIQIGYWQSSQHFYFLSNHATLQFHTLEGQVYSIWIETHNAMIFIDEYLKMPLERNIRQEIAAILSNQKKDPIYHLLSHNIADPTLITTLLQLDFSYNGPLLREQYETRTGQIYHYDTTLLLWAIKRGYSHIVSNLIDQGIEVNQRSNWDASPLHIAIDNNRTEILRMLLELPGIKTTFTDGQGYNALHIAVLKRPIHLEIITMLCEKDHTLIDRQDNYSKSPFNLVMKRYLSTHASDKNKKIYMTIIKKFLSELAKHHLQNRSLQYSNLETPTHILHFFQNYCSVANRFFSFFDRTYDRTIYAIQSVANNPNLIRTLEAQDSKQQVIHIIEQLLIHGAPAQLSHQNSFLQYLVFICNQKGINYNLEITDDNEDYVITFHAPLPDSSLNTLPGESSQTYH